MRGKEKPALHSCSQKSCPTNLNTHRLFELTHCGNHAAPHDDGFLMKGSAEEACNGRHPTGRWSPSLLSALFAHKDALGFLLAHRSEAASRVLPSKRDIREVVPLPSQGRSRRSVSVNTFCMHAQATNEGRHVRKISPVQVVLFTA